MQQRGSPMRAVLRCMITALVGARAQRKEHHMSCGLHTTAPGTFCGPSAIGAVTGVDPVKVEDVILAHRAQHGVPKRTQLRGARVRFTWASEIEPALAQLGWRGVENEIPIYPRKLTFAQWQRKRDRAATYIVLITGHFVAVSGRWFADSGRREPIRLTKAPYRRKRVVRVWSVVKAA